MWPRPVGQAASLQNTTMNTSRSFFPERISKFPEAMWKLQIKGISELTNNLHHPYTMWKHGNVEIRGMSHRPFKTSLTGEREQHLTGSKRGEDRVISLLQLMNINKDTALPNTLCVVRTISLMTCEETGMKGSAGETYPLLRASRIELRRWEVEDFSFSHASHLAHNLSSAVSGMCWLPCPGLLYCQARSNIS